MATFTAPWRKRAGTPENPHRVSSTPELAEASAETLTEVRRKRRKAVRGAILEGAASTPVLQATSNYVTPFALALNASPMQIGLLNGWPNLAAAFVQLLAPGLGKWMVTRKRMLLVSTWVSLLAWVGIMAIPFVLPGNKVWWLIALTTLGLTMYYLPQGAFGSWLADLVPARRLGKVQGARTSLASMGTIIVLLGGGFLLDWFHNHIFLGFSVVFGTILLLRLATLWIFARMYEPALDQRKATTASLGSFLKGSLRSNLGLYLIGYGLIFYGISISGPFFAIRMLKEMHMNYVTYMAVSVSATLTTLIAAIFWGPFADKVGNIRVLKITIGTVVVIPVFWLWVNGVWAAYAIQIVAGIAWGGFSMASLNFVYEASTREERVRNVAYLFAFQGVATFLGNMTGGALLPHMPQVFGSHTKGLFLVSGFVRFLPALMLLTMVHEVRHIVQGEGGRRRWRMPTMFRGRPRHTA